jgi:acetyltransferase-like isoleucine patch superfamily enzyme
MIAELVRRLKAKHGYFWFRVFHSSRILSCGKGAFIDGPFRLDGAEFLELGERSVVQSRSWLYCVPLDGHSGRLRIGARCVFGFNNHISAVRDVVIEDDVLTANNVYISDNIHEYSDVEVPVIYQPVRFKRGVRIGRGTWIGENACVIGASVGRNCVIGANSVVTRDLPDYSVAVGAPARVIRQYDPHEGRWVSK